jgi:hypothetical protein
LISYRVKYRLILTKCDLVLRNVLAQRCQWVVNEIADMKLRYHTQEPIMLSAKLGPGLDVLRRDILHIVQANHLLPKPGSSSESTDKKQTKKSSKKHKS